jgi:hypothetical protein
LKTTIEGDKAAAEAADKAAPGPWVNTGQDGLGDAWQIHGAPTGETTWAYDRVTEESHEVPELRRVATLKYDDGGGVWEREAADHIVLQQPRDTIARCEAELKILDLHGRNEYGYCATCDPDSCGCVGSGVYPCDTLRALAAGRRHRPGFNPDWASE